MSHAPPLVNLGELCDVLDSLRKPVTKRDRVNGPYPYYGATGVQDYVAEYLFDEPLVLVGEDGAKWESGEATAFGVSGKCWVNNHAHVLRPHRDRLLDRWLIYYLTHLDLTPFVSGLTVPKLTQGSLRQIPIPVPSLTEQTRIVAILDQAFAGIDTATTNVEQKLRESASLLQSHLARTFAPSQAGWSRTTIGEIAEIKGGKRVPNGYKMVTENTGYPYLRVTDFREDGTIDTSDMRYVSRAVYEGIKRYVISSDDVYVSIAGTIGRTGIVPKELDGANLTENACRLVLRPNIAKKFVYYFTRTPSFVEQAIGRARTTAQPKLALSRLATVVLWVPSLSTQLKVVETLDDLTESIRSLADNSHTKLSRLSELRSSMLAAAFSGSL